MTDISDKTPTRQKRDNRIVVCIRFSENDLDAIDKLAIENDTNRCHEVREAVRQYLKITREQEEETE